MPSYDQGVYENVEITGQGFSQSKEKKTPYFFLTISPGEYERTISFYLPDGKEDAVDRMLDSLERLGLNMNGLERFAQLDPRSQAHVSFVGSTVTVECKHETNNGKTYERWDVPFLGGVKPVELDQPAIRKLDAMFGKKLKAKAATAKPKPKPAKPLSQDIAEAAAAPEADDEIPF